jgi:hypothetical protein
MGHLFLEGRFAYPGSLLIGATLFLPVTPGGRDHKVAEGATHPRKLSGRWTARLGEAEGAGPTVGGPNQKGALWRPFPVFQTGI